MTRSRAAERALMGTFMNSIPAPFKSAAAAPNVPGIPTGHRTQLIRAFGAGTLYIQHLESLVPGGVCRHLQDLEDLEDLKCLN